MESNQIFEINERGVLTKYHEREEVQEITTADGVAEIPKGIENIEYRCFADSKLKKIEIPGSVKSIGYGALSRIHSLKELILYEGIEEIGEETFAYSILENDGKGLLIPKSVVKIHECAFKITRLHRQVAKLLVYEGSYAHQYVQKIGLEYEIVKE